jgi:hypothetical protein
MFVQERHGDERIDFGRFDLDGSLAAVPASACAAARLTVGCGNVSAG